VGNHFVKLGYSILTLVFMLLLPTEASNLKFTSHREMMVRLATLDAVDDLSLRDRLSVITIGKSVRGRDIPLVVLCNPSVSMDSTKKLFVICRQHGDEPAPTEAVLKLIEDLVLTESEDISDLLAKVSFFIVPMMNPDGADAFKRLNSNNVDLNRDWLSLSQPETKCVHAIINAVAPDVVIDAHELSPTNKGSDFVETVGLDSQASREVVLECLKLQELVRGILQTHNIYVRSYIAKSQYPPRLAHKYFPVHGATVSLLFESRQAGIRRYQLDYRKSLHITGIMTVAKYLAGRESELRQRIAEYDSRKKLVYLASRKSKRALTTKARK
jgi:hypothetical protein